MVPVVLGALAPALTVSDLFGVRFYLVEQRVKEIGVRMALGATTRDDVALRVSIPLRHSKRLTPLLFVFPASFVVN